MARVLIIEDSPTEAHLYRRALEKHGFVVETAVDGEAGIKSATENPPDLILMDVVMPGVNGFQATRELHKLKATAEVPIIIITTKDQETDRIWGMRQGAVDYLIKPVSKSALAKRVKEVLVDSQRATDTATHTATKARSKDKSQAIESDSASPDGRPLEVFHE